MPDEKASVFVTWAEFEELNKEHEKLDEMVFVHEDIISTLLFALKDEENLSIDAKEVINDAYDMLHGKGRYDKKEGGDGK